MPARDPATEPHVLDTAGTDYLVLPEIHGLRYRVDGAEWPAGTHEVPADAYVDGEARYLVTIEIADEAVADLETGPWELVVASGEPSSDDEPVAVDDDDTPGGSPTAPDPVDEPVSGEHPPAGTDEETAREPGDDTDSIGPAPLVAVPVPAVERIAVAGGDGYRLPHGGMGLTWYVDGVPVVDLVATGAARFVRDDAVVGAEDDGGPAAWYEVGARALGTEIDELVVAAAAAPGFVLTTADDGTASVHYVLDPRTPVEPALPSPVDGPGRDDVITVPAADGQEVRDSTGEVLEPGDHPVTAEYLDGQAVVDLTVHALPGHRLERDGVVLDSSPGRSAAHPVRLTFTDLVEPDELPDTPTASDPAPPPESEPATDPGDEPDGAPAVVVPTALTVSDEPAPQAEPEVASQGVDQAAEQPSGSGPAGVETTVLLGVLFLAGAGTILGFGRDAA